MNFNKHSFALMSTIIGSIISLIAFFVFPIIIAFDEYKQIVLIVLTIYQKAWWAMVISFTCLVMLVVTMERICRKRATQKIANVSTDTAQ